MPNSESPSSSGVTPPACPQAVELRPVPPGQQPPVRLRLRQIRVPTARVRGPAAVILKECARPLSSSELALLLIPYLDTPSMRIRSSVPIRGQSAIRSTRSFGPFVSVAGSRSACRPLGTIPRPGSDLRLRISRRIKSSFSSSSRTPTLDNICEHGMYLRTVVQRSAPYLVPDVRFEQIRFGDEPSVHSSTFHSEPLLHQPALCYDPARQTRPYRPVCPATSPSCCPSWTV